MKKQVLVGLAALLLLTPPAIAQDKGPSPTRPTEDPDWAKIRRVAEAAFRNDMFDPGSATFAWHGGWRWGHIKPFKLWSKREWGWLGCVAVNGKNRMGGYVGATDYYILITPSGKVTYGPYTDVTSECDDGSSPVPLQTAFIDIAPSGTPVSVADELEKLSALKDKGIITQTEFDAQKAKLLSR